MKNLISFLIACLLPAILNAAIVPVKVDTETGEIISTGGVTKTEFIDGNLNDGTGAIDMGTIDANTMQTNTLEATGSGSFGSITVGGYSEFSNTVNANRLEVAFGSASNVSIHSQATTNTGINFATDTISMVIDESTALNISSTITANLPIVSNGNFTLGDTSSLYVGFSTGNDVSWNNFGQPTGDWHGFGVPFAALGPIFSRTTGAIVIGTGEYAPGYIGSNKLWVKGPSTLDDGQISTDGTGNTNIRGNINLLSDSWPGNALNIFAPTGGASGYALTQVFATAGYRSAYYGHSEGNSFVFVKENSGNIDFFNGATGGDITFGGTSTSEARFTLATIIKGSSDTSLTIDAGSAQSSDLFSVWDNAHSSPYFQIDSAGNITHAGGFSTGSATVGSLTSNSSVYVTSALNVDAAGSFAVGGGFSVDGATGAVTMGSAGVTASGAPFIIGSLTTGDDITAGLSINAGTDIYSANDIETTATAGAGGFILKSPDGERWLIEVSNTGVLTAAPAP